MSVTASDIVIYYCENKPTTDLTTAGGAIDSGVRATFTDIAATDTVEISGTNASDTGVITIGGRNSAGIIVSENITMSGLTLVSGSQSFERILSVYSDSTANGNIIVRDASTDTTIGTVFTNESGFQRVFYDATANAAGGANKTLYDKVFIKNNNTTTALNNVTVTEVVTGLYSIVEFGLTQVKQDSETTLNRTNAPTGVLSYGSGSSGLPETSYLNPFDYQAVWLKLDLTAGASSQNSFYRLQVDGTTT
jgi:hypothetical protein